MDPMTSLPPGRKKTRPIRLVLLLGLTALLFLLILDRYGAATGAGL
jgi:hypothetical protein